MTMPRSLHGRIAFVCGVSSIVCAMVTAHAATTQGREVQPKIVQQITASLHERYPEVPVQQIHESPLPGVYEVLAGSDILYTNDTGSLVLVGRLIDTKSKEDLTLKHWSQLNGIDFGTLPLDLAIKVVRGNGKTTLAVFADPLCPYCHELEQTLDGLSDSTVYVFLYPLETIHPGATEVARKIWCTPNRAGAWTGWMSKETSPTQASCDEDSLPKIQALAEKLQINSTPTLFLSNGDRLRGLPSRERLQELLKASG